MSITRTIWINSFTVKNIPEWVCPTCSKGVLVGEKKGIKIIESVLSLKARDHDDWDPDWMGGSFGGTLKCNNEKCGELVVIRQRRCSVNNIPWPCVFFHRPRTKDYFAN